MRSKYVTEMASFIKVNCVYLSLVNFTDPEDRIHI
jgi:hypothetical protein